MDRHNAVVAEICVRVRYLHILKTPFRIYHGSTNSTRESQKSRSNTVDISMLSNVLKVDPETRTALIEPNVPMDKLVESTLEYGLLPPVVMEFPGITAGGGFAGSSGESSSFKFGTFDGSVNWVDIVLADGEKMRASANENSELFHGAAESLGTLGVTTLLELQLIDAKQYVELTYLPVQNMDQIVQQFEEASNDPKVDYIDGLMFSKSTGVLCVGSLVNKASVPNTSIERFSRAWDNWYYIHTENIYKKFPTSPYTELIPIKDYLFRYDRGAFWMGRGACMYFLMPFCRLTRWLLNPIMSTRAIYTIGHATNGPNQATIQDVSIPLSKSTEFYEYLDKEWDLYPIWLCPIKPKDAKMKSPYSLTGLANAQGELPTMLMNFGVWGAGFSNLDESVHYNRLLEKKIKDLGGQKILYSRSYYTEDEFAEIFDLEQYDRLRIKYHAEHLPTVFKKVVVDVEAEKKRVRDLGWRDFFAWWFWGMWPIAGWYGVWCWFTGGNALLTCPEVAKKKE